MEEKISSLKLLQGLHETHLRLFETDSINGARSLSASAQRNAYRVTATGVCDKNCRPTSYSTYCSTNGEAGRNI